MSEKLCNKKVNQLTGQLILAGEGGKSQYIDFAASNTKRISRYKFIHVNEEGSVTISNTNSEMLIIDYRYGDVRGAFLAVENEDNRYFLPIKGVVCGIWCEEKKKSNKWHFTWCDIQEKDYKHAEFKSFGFDDDLVMEIFGMLFSCLQKTLCNSISTKIPKGLLDVTSREEGYDDSIK